MSTVAGHLSRANPISKVLAAFLLLLVAAMPGCVSFEVVKLAKGYTNEEIWPSQVEKGDKIVDTIDDSAAVYIVRHKGQKDSTKATIPKIPENYSVFLANPRPAYYTLLLLSVPIDVATLPIQIICLPFTTLPVSH